MSQFSWSKRRTPLSGYVNVFVKGFPGVPLPPVIPVFDADAATIADLQDAVFRQLPAALQQNGVYITTSSNKRLDDYPHKTVASFCHESDILSLRLQAPLRGGADQDPEEQDREYDWPDERYPPPADSARSSWNYQHEPFGPYTRAERQTLEVNPPHGQPRQPQRLVRGRRPDSFRSQDTNVPSTFLEDSDFSPGSGSALSGEVDPGDRETEPEPLIEPGRLEGFPIPAAGPTDRREGPPRPDPRLQGIPEEGSSIGGDFESNPSGSGADPPMTMEELRRRRRRFFGVSSGSGSGSGSRSSRPPSSLRQEVPRDDLPRPESGLQEMPPEGGFDGPESGLYEMPPEGGFDLPESVLHETPEQGGEGQFEVEPEHDQTFIYGLDDSEQTFYNDNGDDQSYEQHPDDTAGDAGHDDGMRTHFEEDVGHDDGMRTHFEDLDIEDPGDNQGAEQHPDDTGGGTGHDDGRGTFFDDGSMAPPPPPPPGPPEMGGDHAFHASEAEHTSSSWLHLR